MARAVLSVAASHARNPVARFGAIKPSKAHIVTSTLPSRKRSTRTSSRAAFIQASYSYYEETEYKPPPQWPDKDFITEVLDRFPDEGVCNVEEGVVGFWCLSIVDYTS